MLTTNKFIMSPSGFYDTLNNFLAPQEKHFEAIWCCCACFDPTNKNNILKLIPRYLDSVKIVPQGESYVLTNSSNYYECIS